MEMTPEQRKRVNQHKTAFYKYMLEGTICHCRKLFYAGMASEAVEILADFTGKSESEVRNILISD